MATKTEQATIPAIEIKQFTVKIVGDSPLVVHAWSTKAKELMLAKQMKQAIQGKQAKNPQDDYEACLYYMEDGSYGFPSIGLKAAAVSASRYIDGAKMTEARGAFHINGDLVKITGTPRMREDMVRVAMGTADIRYRPEFTEWSAEFVVRFNARAMSAEQIVNLFNTAGFGVGIGEHRPEKDGSWGMFHVESAE